ncbi:hypothetical protein ACFYYB_13495 [Streptomyces sp. NPDC002886]|uniref:hypothetical protein n=1 Tax=Streptomyces sp. NPDC002886 TaxID=3364667 RepID=UPI00368F9FE0
MQTLKATSEPQSLFWAGREGADLVDPVGGFRRWTPDGREHPARRPASPAYDRAVRSPSGRWTVLYEERGTRAVLLDGERIARELPRGDNLPEDYDHAVALGALPDGREVLVSCPEEYDVLEVEDVSTGERLTTGERTTPGTFQSRLSVSPDGRKLLVAGWVWHPFGVANVYDLAAAFADATALDRDGDLLGPTALYAEVGSACWLDADRVAVSGTGEGPGDEEASTLQDGQLGVWSCRDGRWLYRSAGAGGWGTLVACGGNLVVSLTGHPRLVDATTGRVLRQWPEIGVRHRDGAYGVTDTPSAVTALHPDGTRLAVALETGIAVLDLPQT